MELLPARSNNPGKLRRYGMGLLFAIAALCVWRIRQSTLLIATISVDSTQEWDTSKRSTNILPHSSVGSNMGGRISTTTTTTTTTLNAREPLPWPPGWKNHKIGLQPDHGPQGR
jgi:hypothetical protein